MSVNVGDKVLLPEFGGTEIKLGDDTFHLFRDEDIWKIRGLGPDGRHLV